MPRLTYTPEGASPRHWDIEFGKFMSPERVVIEKATGLGWTAVQRAFFQDRTDVIGAFLFVLMKRDIPTLKASEVQWCGDEIEVDLTDAEALQFVEAVEAEPEALEDEDVAEELERLRARLGDLLEADPADPPAGG